MRQAVPADVMDAPDVAAVHRPAHHHVIAARDVLAAATETIVTVVTVTGALVVLVVALEVVAVPVMADAQANALMLVPIPAVHNALDAEVLARQTATDSVHLDVLAPARSHAKTIAVQPALAHVWGSFMDLPQYPLLYHPINKHKEQKY